MTESQSPTQSPRTTAAPPKAAADPNAAPAPTLAPSLSGAPPAPEPTVPAWQEALRDVDPQELLAHLVGTQRIKTRDILNLPELSRTLDGIVGSRAATIADAKLAEARAAQETAELKRLRTEDPDEFARRHAELEQRQAEIDARRQELDTRLATVVKDLNQSVAEFAQKLPEPVARKFAGKEYPGSLAEGLTQYLQDIQRELATHYQEHDIPQRMQAELARREKAIRKELLGEAADNEEPLIDTNSGAGSSSGSRTINQDEFHRHRRDAKWMSENYDKVSAAIASGAIRS